MWEIIWYDVLYKIKTKLSFLSTNHLQTYNSLVEIAGALFGDKKNKPEPIKINDLDAKTAVNVMNSVLGAT